MRDPRLLISIILYLIGGIIFYIGKVRVAIREGASDDALNKVREYNLPKRVVVTIFTLSTIIISLCWPYAVIKRVIFRIKRVIIRKGI